MQTRRGRRGTWKCRVSKYRVLFLFIRWRDAKLLGLLLPSLFEPESFLLSNNEIFSFFFPLLTHPACTKKQKEIFKGIRARKLYSSAAIPSKNIVHKHLPGETNPVSSMRRRGVYAQRSIAIRGRSF